MRNPATHLDDRFSDPGTDATSWETTQQALEDAQISWITTVRSDGRPHVTPLVAVWVDGVLYFSTGAEEQKGVNLVANQNVALTTGCNIWDDSLDVVVEGVARLVTDEALLARLADAWRGKWDGSWQFTVSDGGFESSGHHALVYAVDPAKVLAFGRQRPPATGSMLPSVAFTHTTHTSHRRSGG